METEINLAISIIYKVLEICLRYSAILFITILNMELLMLINKARTIDIISYKSKFTYSYAFARPKVISIKNRQLNK